MAPPPVVAVPDDGKDHPEDLTATQADDTLHKQIGEYHQAIIRAAFACDLTRVATFQWSPGTNHIAFKGLNPDDLAGVYTHHPVSHNVSNADVDNAAPTPSGRPGRIQYLVNVDAWYSARMAEFLTTLKNTQDTFGNPLLDNMVVPYISEVSKAYHAHNQMPLSLFGGKNLGIKGGQFVSFPTTTSYVDYLLTVMAAFGVRIADLQGQPILDSPHGNVLPGVLL
jgi:hypothetical protein